MRYLYPLPIGDLNASNIYVRTYMLFKFSRMHSNQISGEQEMETLILYPTFINFLRSIPGRNGVPLSYNICREYDQPEPNNPNISFIENYILQAPLFDATFDVDASKVLT